MTQWLEQVLEQCERYGYRAIPNKDGRPYPFGDGQTYKRKDFAQCKDYVSVALDDVVLLDYDGNKGDVMSVSDLEDALDLFEMPEMAQVNEAGDSIHWLFKLPEGVDADQLAHSADGHWPHIDIKRGNQLIHLKPGKTLQLVAKDQLEECPQVIIDALTRPEGVVGEDDDLGDFAGLLEPEISEDRVVEMLGKLDPDMGGKDWSTVGNALFEWDEVKGLELWGAWSKGSDKYKEGECQARWRSMSHGGGVTMGTLFHMEKAADYDTEAEQVEKIIRTINNSDEKALRLDVVKQIASLEIDSFERERLAQTIKGRFKALTGVVMPISDCRQLITPKVVSGELTDDIPRPEWCRGIVYVNAEGDYVNTETGQTLSTASFNLTYGRCVPVSESGGKPSASRFVADYGLIDVCSHSEYLPFEEERIVERRGGNILNTFDSSSLPMAEPYTDQGQWAVERVREHLAFLCNNNEEDVAILEQWFAWQVQHMGRKLMFAPLICSIQGIGKSVLEVMLRGMLGTENVGTVSPQEVKREFNPWATGVSVNVLNELKINGMNRHEISNSLKPLITDDHIMINKKGVSQYQARNTTNYIAFTNFVDAIPIEETDRRWWPIRVNITDISELETIFNKSVDEYFKDLVKAVREYPGQLKKYFMEYKITDEFRGLVRAPESDFKADMVRAEDSRTEWLDEIKEIIEEGKTPYVTKVAISISALCEAVNENNYGFDSLSIKQLSGVLRKLGYTPQKRARYGDERMIVWTNKNLTKDDILKLFKLE